MNTRWVEFLADFSWRDSGPNPDVTAYEKGMTEYVSKACAEAAVAAGAARLLTEEEVAKRRKR